MQLKAKRQTKKHMKQKTKVNKKNIRSKNTQRRFRNKRRTKKKRSHKGGSYYSECKNILEDIFTELEGETDTKSKPNNELIYRQLKEGSNLFDDKRKIIYYLYATNIPMKKKDKDTLEALNFLVKDRSVLDMLSIFEIMGFFRPNTELVKHGSKLKMDTCQNKTSIPISRYARNLDSLIKIHFLNEEEREYYNKDNFVRKYYNIFNFMLVVNKVVKRCEKGIEILNKICNKDKNDRPKIDDYVKGRKDEDIDKELRENTEKWMEWFEDRLEILLNDNDSKFPNDYDNDTDTDSTQSLSHESLSHESLSDEYP